MTNLDNLEGTRTPEELAEDFRELNRIAPTPADRFKLMFSAMNDLPANLPPLPPVPPGFDRWVERGHGWESACAEFPGMMTMPIGDLSSDDAWCAYYEAVRDEPAKCDNCGGSNIVDNCAMCGAPQCCHDCCAKTTRALLDERRAK